MTTAQLPDASKPSLERLSSVSLSECQSLAKDLLTDVIARQAKTAGSKIF